MSLIGGQGKIKIIRLAGNVIIMGIEETASKILRSRYLCDHCLGRMFGQLLSGLTNEERGKIVRYFLAFQVDSGKKIEIHPSNFYGIKFRNVKITAAPSQCFICGNFFEEKINELAERIAARLKEIEFESFLIGSRLPDGMLAAEERVMEDANIEWVEMIKSEINRELGKRLEKLAGKKFQQKNPDVTILADLKNDRISLQARSLYIFGGYKKLVRGIPQTKWICSKCGGKGCIACKGTGKLYPTSVQEEIERPFLKATGAKKSSFHGGGREDIDARCLDWRPFVIELEKPVKRKIKLRKAEEEINRSKKVKVRGLKAVGDGHLIRRLKAERLDKSYLATVEFEKPIERSKLKELRQLTQAPILQQTPTRVLHRRADRTRKRLVKAISCRLLGRRKLQLTLRAQSGLYIKELIAGDEGRTKPSIAEILENRVRKILLDVVKIHGRVAPS